MIVAVDFDSVLSDLAALQVLSYNIKHGTQLTKDQINDWWWWKDQEHPEFVWGSDCFTNKQWMLATPPVAGAVTGMANLLADGHVLHVISDREPHMKEWIGEWLDHHDIYVDSVHVTGHGGWTKADAYEGLGIEAGIDDAPHNIEKLHALVDTMVVFDQPWNRKVETDGFRIVRARSWVELVHHLYNRPRRNRDQGRYRKTEAGPGRTFIPLRHIPGHDAGRQEVQRA
jgi:5'(3')-deoxyribonucleotidase